MPVMCPHCNRPLDSIDVKQHWTFRLDNRDGTWQWKLLEAQHSCTHCGEKIDNELMKEAGLTSIYNPLIWYGESSPWRKLRIRDKTKRTGTKNP